MRFRQEFPQDFREFAAAWVDAPSSGAAVKKSVPGAVLAQKAGEAGLTGFRLAVLKAENRTLRKPYGVLTIHIT